MGADSAYILGQRLAKYARSGEDIPDEELYNMLKCNEEDPHIGFAYLSASLAGALGALVEREREKKRGFSTGNLEGENTAEKLDRLELRVVSSLVENQGSLPLETLAEVFDSIHAEVERGNPGISNKTCYRLTELLEERDMKKYRERRDHLRKKLDHN